MKIQFCFVVVLVFSSAVNLLGQGVIPTPTLISPTANAELDNGCANKKDSIEWNFKWSRISDAKRYQLYVIGGTANYPVIDITNIKDPSYQHLRQAAYIIDANRTGWRWKVRALVGSFWTDWSEERVFDVEPIDTDCD